MDLLREHALNAVAEGEIPATFTSPRHTRQASSQASVASPQVLRTQAQGVRRSLQRLKRQSLDAPPSDPDATLVRNEVQALEATLSRQEQVIHQLEQVIPSSPRTIAGNSVSPGAQKYETYFNEEEHDGMVSEDDDEEDTSMDHGTRAYFDESDLEHAGHGQRHEDRADAFDYETFILNNALGGAYDNVPPKGKWSDKSTLGPESNFQPPKQHKRLPLVTGTSEGLSRRGSDDLDRLLASSWPMPPTVRGLEDSAVEAQEPIIGISSEAINVSQAPIAAVPPEPVREQSKGHAQKSSIQDTEHTTIEFGREQDATSVILSALLSPTSDATNRTTISKCDQSLLFSLATALRDACSRLGEDGEAGRQRLVEATKLLKGEA